MMSKLLQSAALAASMMLAVSAVQAQELKIGFVNGERVLRDSNAAKAAQTKLDGEFGKRERELLEQESKLRAVAEKLEKEAPVLSEGERARRQRDFMEQDRDLQRKKRTYQEDLSQSRNEVVSALFERANRVIKQIAEAEKYDLILQEGVVHFSSRVDITKRVIDAMNAQK
ncbi:MAG: OmpH family outer membrane protein [Rubrivivax sp.]|nr:MAG: OmpH family outer membrane protein [Rubrivivax sp.]